MRVQGEKLTHKNLPAADLELKISWSDGASSTTFQADASLVEAWGDPGGSEISMFFQNDSLGNNHNFNVITPWGTYFSGVISGLILAGHLRCYLTGVTLVVNADCTWTWSTTGMTFYFQSGVGEDTLLTLGAQTVSGTGYDERLNRTGISPHVIVQGSGDPRCGIGTAATWSANATVNGGYRWYPGGSATEDDIVIGTLLVNGSCSPCEGTATPPTISGTSSYNVSATTTAGGQISFTDGTIACPGCTPSSLSWELVQINNFTTTASVQIKDKYVLVGDQHFHSQWDCTLDLDGVVTSSEGSTDATTTPTFTTCATALSLDSTIGYSICGTTKKPFCPINFPCNLPSLPADCHYQASSALTWPTFPSCIPPLLGPDILQTANGEFYVAAISTGNLYACYSPIPDPRWLWVVPITSDGGWSNPAIAKDSQGQIEYRATQTVSSVATTYRLWSNDRGKTWNPLVAGVLAPEVVLSNSTQCKVRFDSDGNGLEMTFVPDSGTSGPGTFSARVKRAGSTSWSSPFVPTSSAGGNLRSDGSGFGHDHATEGPNRWYLAMVADGDSTISEWWSGDTGKSWKEA